MAATRRISKSAVDWAAFAARISEDQLPQFRAFKTRHDGYIGRLQSFPEQPPAIDWSYYTSKIPDTSLVQEFKKGHAAVKVPYPPDTVSKEIDQEEKESLEETKEFIKQSVLRIEKFKVNLKRWEEMLPIHKMTQEEFVLTFPDHAWGIDQKRYQTLGNERYNPKHGIPGEIGSGVWNIGPSRHKEVIHHDH